LPGLALGLDAYYKRSTDTLDDGQFGQAVVLNQFNYARGFSRGAELKVNYYQGGFRAYANVSHEITMVKDVVSNQYLIGDPVELAYLATTDTYASDAQTVTASAGTAYRWHTCWRASTASTAAGCAPDLRTSSTRPATHNGTPRSPGLFDPWNNQKPLTLRLSAINLFDRSYVLREATGIGEFAPQYGPRRGVFAEINQQF
jgi:outer membrane receptor protein involved in Fe transport